MFTTTRTVFQPSSAIPLFERPTFDPAAADRFVFQFHAQRVVEVFEGSEAPLYRRSSTHPAPPSALVSINCQTSAPVPASCDAPLTLPPDREKLVDFASSPNVECTYTARNTDCALITPLKFTTPVGSNVAPVAVHAVPLSGTNALPLLRLRWGSKRLRGSHLRRRWRLCARMS